MSIARLSLVLLSSLLVMLAVVILRSERTRLQFETSQRDRDTEVLLQEVRERELELARLSNPGVIRKRLMDLKIDGNPRVDKPPRP